MATKKITTPTVSKGVKNQERERLINRFISRIFKFKAQGLTKIVSLLKVKIFIRQNGMKWTSSLESLFESTWMKQVPRDIQERNNPKPSRAKVKPNSPKLSVEIQEQGDGRQSSKPVPGIKVKPNVRPYVKDEPRFDEPEDIDDPKWDEPLLYKMLKKYVLDVRKSLNRVLLTLKDIYAPNVLNGQITFFGMGIMLLQMRIKNIERTNEIGF
jgi:hypothetical protein